MFSNKKFGAPPVLLKKYHQLALLNTLSIVCLQIPYRGDVGTYRVTKSALMASDLDLPFVPCIGGFHLQMEWCQVSRIKCKLDSNVNELPNCCSDSLKNNTYELGERTVKRGFLTVELRTNLVTKTKYMHHSVQLMNEMENYFREVENH